MRANPFNTYYPHLINTLYKIAFNLDVFYYFCMLITPLLD